MTDLAQWKRGDGERTSNRAGGSCEEEAGVLDLTVGTGSGVQLRMPNGIIWLAVRGIFLCRLAQL